MTGSKTTGRFDTREELCEFVWSDWLNTPRNVTQIAAAARVSPAVVSKILDKGEGKPKEGDGE